MDALRTHCRRRQMPFAASCGELMHECSVSEVQQVVRRAERSWSSECHWGMSRRVTLFLLLLSTPRTAHSMLADCSCTVIHVAIRSTYQPRALSSELPVRHNHDHSISLPISQLHSDRSSKWRAYCESRTTSLVARVGQLVQARSWTWRRMLCEVR